uniref:Uncharacterized protein AlNc14C2G265 n=1 Tax=Albugo laibachii Nc14 TaxID=890382 RepID=F0VZC7_9STRA|nr:conserved hypothetical protein [Albugo laibachii Nc14]|eukprot:CCA14157.1 conserved hypothetical protein [Albugo laibachii Nc14]
MTGSPVQCQRKIPGSPSTKQHIRIYIGGLSHGDNTLDLQTRIQSFVEQQRTGMHKDCALILPIQVMQEKNPSSGSKTTRLRGFGYADFKGEDVSSVVSDLIKVFNKTKWRGSVLKFETAKPHYIEKLRKEWMELETRQITLREKAQKEIEQFLAKCENKSIEIRPLNMTIMYSGSRRRFRDVDERVASLSHGNRQEATEEKDTNSGSSESYPENPDVSGVVATAMKHSKVVDGSPEKKSANMKRLEALNRKSKIKEALAMKQKGIGISAVGGSCNKKVIFDDDAQPVHSSKTDEDLSSDDIEVDDWMITTDADTEKWSIKTLDFASDPDEDNAEPDSCVFAVRPEFTGVKGKELLELQKSYRGDSRFRLDTRFAEEFIDSIDDVDGNNAQGDFSHMESCIQSFRQDDSADEKTDESDELQEELDRALVVVNGLFPEINFERLKTTYKARACLKEKLARNEFTKSVVRDASWMGVSLRYNPTIPAHNQIYEIREIQRDAFSEKVADTRADHGSKLVNPIESKLGGPRYFTASDGLNSMFSRVRKNSEDGIVGEAALDGVFEKKSAATDLIENEVEPAKSESSRAFKLSSLFDFAFEDHASTQLVTMSSKYLSDEDTNAKENEDFTLGDDTNALKTERISSSEAEADEGSCEDADCETDSEDTEKETLPVTNTSVRCIDDLLELGTLFAKGQSTHKLDWQTFRAKMAIDFKRKRKEALKTRKKKQKSHK